VNNLIVNAGKSPANPAFTFCQFTGVFIFGFAVGVWEVTDLITRAISVEEFFVTDVCWGLAVRIWIVTVVIADAIVVPVFNPADVLRWGGDAFAVGVETAALLQAVTVTLFTDPCTKLISELNTIRVIVR